MRVVLVEPEIPQNTGNIARTCVLTGLELHLVEPLGFSLDERRLKRAGLDYWKALKLKVHPSWNELKEAFPGERYFFFSTRGDRLYSHISYSRGDLLIFGSETKGLPVELLQDHASTVRVPMLKGIKRSLNLGNTVALVVYEALRQQGFSGME